jgi:thiol-disulfide isomerase/thioredoxin
MKIFLIISYCVVCITSTAQKKIYASLNLVYPVQLTYDTLLVKNSLGKVISETSTFTNGGKTINTYLINVDPMTAGAFSIYFGGSLSAINDTLYFLSYGRDLLIELKDSFALRYRINLELRNVYNFEELYKRYNQYLNFQMEKYDSFIKNNSGYQFSKQQYYLSAGLDFVKQNIKNPYSIDLFSVFIINPPLFHVEYSKANRFYLKYLKSKIKDPKTRKFVENKIGNLRQSLDEGSTAPFFSALSIQGKIVSSHSLSGKNVLLIFWATWCVPCMEELPYLKQIYEEYKGDNLVMVSVSLDSDSLKMANVVVEKKLNWVQIFNNRGIIGSYRINPIPAVFFINEKGRILFNSSDRRDEASNLKILKSLLRQKFKH